MGTGKTGGLGGKRWLLTNSALVLAIIFTSVAIVQTSHHCRLLYAQLQEMQSDQWSMQENWGRLLLEESTWAAHHRVEEVAVGRLGMQVPPTSEVQVIEP